jgi:hypothetical protein
LQHLLDRHRLARFNNFGLKHDAKGAIPDHAVRRQLECVALRSKR